MMTIPADNDGNKNALPTRELHRNVCIFVAFYFFFFYFCIFFEVRGERQTQTMPIEIQFRLMSAAPPEKNPL